MSQDTRLLLEIIRLVKEIEAVLDCNDIVLDNWSTWTSSSARCACCVSPISRFMDRGKSSDWVRGVVSIPRVQIWCPVDIYLFDLPLHIVHFAQPVLFADCFFADIIGEAARHQQYTTGRMQRDI